MLLHFLDEGYIAAFSDSECQNQLGARAMGLNVCSVSNHYYYYAEEANSVKMACSTTTAKPLDTSSSYVLERY